MDLRNVLASVAVITLAGALPAAAQAPRSLFEAAPADSSPVTMGLDKTAPASAPVKAAKAEEPATSPPVQMPASSAPITALPAKPDTASVAATKPDTSSPTKPASAAQDNGRRSRRLASREDASKPLAPEAIPLATPQAAPEAAAPKPLTRAEQRRARRDARRQAAAVAAAPMAPATPAPINPLQSLFGGFQQPQSAPSTESMPGRSAGRSEIDALVAQHARLNNVPESLVHRIIVRESKYNPRAVGRGGAMGLMQIKTATARGVGYTGGPAGLLDAETNIKYAVKYLAGAWRVSGGSHDRAVSHYARGYYYEAKRMGIAGPRGRRGQEQADPAAASAQQAPSLFSFFRQ